LASLIPWANRRDAINLATDADRQAVHDAFRAVFQMAADAGSWRYCYGIVAKHGYAVNSELFSRLDIFCRAMMTASAITFLVSVTLWLVGRFEWSGQALLWILAGSALGFVVFLKSARTYSRAFVGAIYEGFYSWYVDAKLP